MSARTNRPPASSGIKRSVITRVLWSYTIVVLVFALVAGWSALALSSAAAEAGLMRSGYYPLALAVRELVAKQDTYNAQLNHITSASNPADLRVWFDFALKIGRPRLFGAARAAVGQAFAGSSDDGATRHIADQLMRELSAIERLLAHDGEDLPRLFEVLERDDVVQAERLRDELVTRGSQASLRLRRLELRVEEEVDRLLDQARARERLAIRLLVALSSVSLLVGLTMALYARRVLRPLGAMTERAKAVTGGDLEPRAPIQSGDELGELSTTFEGMVAAIARANERLVASERLATIGKMAAHVTHEIRNPLSSIALNLELLEEELGGVEPSAAGGGRNHDVAEQKTLLRAIGNEVERLNALSKQYLSFARQRQSSIAEEDLETVVREACDFLRRELGAGKIELELSSDAGLEPVLVDEGQIKQALFNLLRNARDAMPAGGRIRVGVGAAPGGARIVIEDEGTGLDEATRAHLFEPFFTTKRHGTGLGLAITRQIVESHGGSIEFSSPERGGTRVTVSLPARGPEPAAPGEERSEAGQAPASSGTP